ncbi:MAG: translation elongation factor T, partial [Candidatus Berkelbacteria bacterium Licking1014_85]
ITKFNIMPTIDQIKSLRETTQASLGDISSALKEANGDEKKALEILKSKGAIKAAKKSEREVKSGLIDCYIHINKIGTMVEVNCETDFVAKNQEFKNFVHNIAMQISSMMPDSVEELLEQEYIKDNSMTIKQLLESIIAKTGENIKIARFSRYELGGITRK